MTCTVVLEIRVKPEHADGMSEAFKGLFPDTRSYDGCIGLYATRNMDDPQNFAIVETWESREKYEKYFDWRVETGVIEQVKGMLVEGTDINLRFFDRLGA
jgi:quinol monooxygenase YgiN